VLALLIRMSTGPSSAAACPAIEYVACASATSAAIAYASPPPERIAATVSSSGGAFRATNATRAPRAASSRPSSRPSPRLPPVITAALSRMSMGVSSWPAGCA